MTDTEQADAVIDGLARDEELDRLEREAYEEYAQQQAVELQRWREYEHQLAMEELEREQSVYTRYRRG